MAANSADRRLGEQAFEVGARTRKPRSAVCSKSSYMHGILADHRRGCEEGAGSTRRGSPGAMSHQRKIAVPHARPAPKPLSRASRPGVRGLRRWPRRGPAGSSRPRCCRSGRGCCRPAARDVQHVDGGVDDADVGLVRDVQVDVVRASGSACLEHVLNGVAQDGDGPAKDGPAVHVHVVQALVEQLGRRRQPAAAGGPAQQVAAAAVGAQAVAEDALVRPAARSAARRRRRRRRADRS